MILLDTNVIIDLLNNEEDARWNYLSQEGCVICGIVISELYSGIRGKKEAKAIEASGYGTYTRNADDSIYDVKNISEFFFREDGTLYIVYAYGNNNYTSELDIIQI